jgi:hypothetical protein
VGTLVDSGAEVVEGKGGGGESERRRRRLATLWRLEGTKVGKGASVVVDIFGKLKGKDGRWRW